MPICRLSPTDTELTVSDGDVVQLDDISKFPSNFIGTVTVFAGPKGVKLRPTSGQQINGVSGDLTVSMPVQLSISSGKWQALAAPAQIAVAGGTISANTTLSWNGPRVFDINSSPTITIPAADAAHEGEQFRFKQTDAGAAVISGQIDGASSFTFSAQNEDLIITVINGQWSI